MPHTPGPWTATGRYIHSSSGADFGLKDILAIVDGDLYIHAADADGHDGRIASNARLIAAAPELFEALRRWVALADYSISALGVEPHGEEKPVLEAARAALSKAEGSPLPPTLAPAIKPEMQSPGDAFSDDLITQINEME